MPSVNVASHITRCSSGVTKQRKAARYQEVTALFSLSELRKQGRVTRHTDNVRQADRSPQTWRSITAGLRVEGDSAEMYHSAKGTSADFFRKTHPFGFRTF